MFYTAFLAVVLTAIAGLYLGRNLKPNIVSLELTPNVTAALGIVEGWSRAGVLGEAIASTWLDFGFLVAYSITLAFACLRANRSANRVWQQLGNGFALLALLAGVCDVTENLGLLHAMSRRVEQPWVLVTFVVALIKWVLIACCLLFWLTSSLVHRYFGRLPG